MVGPEGGERGDVSVTRNTRRVAQGPDGQWLCLAHGDLARQVEGKQSMETEGRLGLGSGREVDGESPLRAEILSILISLYPCLLGE